MTLFFVIPEHKTTYRGFKLPEACSPILGAVIWAGEIELWELEQAQNDSGELVAKANPAAIDELKRYYKDTGLIEDAEVAIYARIS